MLVDWLKQVCWGGVLGRLGGNVASPKGAISKAAYGKLLLFACCMLLIFADSAR